MSWKPCFVPRREPELRLTVSYDNLSTTESILSKTLMKHYSESCIEFFWETLKKGLTDSPGDKITRQIPTTVWMGTVPEAHVQQAFGK